MNKLEDIVKQKLYHAEMDLPDGDWDVFAKKMSTETKERTAHLGYVVGCCGYADGFLYLYSSALQ